MEAYVRKNDTVVAISGRDKGRTGEVLRVIPKTDKVAIRGVNLVRKYRKPSRQNMQGGIIEMEAAVNSSKVMLFHKKCKKAARVNHKLSEGGARVRVCEKYGEAF